MSKRTQRKQPERYHRDEAADPAPRGYAPFLRQLKDRIRTARTKAVLSVNRELIKLYGQIGKALVERQRTEGWGRSIVERLSMDLRSEFPNVHGFSPQNLWHMRAFYLAWTEDALNLPQPAGEFDGVHLPEIVFEMPWYHNVVLFEKVKAPHERIWYARKAVEHGWSRAVLVHQIELGSFDRQGMALTNFDRSLPPRRSDMAQQSLKDPYVFDFLTMAEDVAEKELERGLLENIRKFLQELGTGFAFVGSQYHLEIDAEDFYIDLLFYHLRLRCFVIIDLKTGNFKPEYAGKMNFYLAALDDRLRYKTDNPSIGLILCKTKKKVIAEYALRNMGAPIGVSEYMLTRKVPAQLRENLPSIEDLEKKLGRRKRTQKKRTMADR
jgi:predicted nuclease of restriction endonuclease-like (RecB) superfamily